MIVRKGGLSLSAPAHFVRSADRGRVRAGAPVLVNTPSGSMNRAVGYYVAHSDADMDYDQPLTRIYVNVGPGGGAALLRDLCEQLNTAEQPFDFKVANDIALYHRCDVAVLYVPRARAGDIWTVLRPVLGRHSRHLRPPVPALVHRLRPGVGVADDPANGYSFGLDRCRAIATGLVRAAAETAEDPWATRLVAVSSALAEHGINPAFPYLTADRSDPYAALG